MPADSKLHPEDLSPVMREYLGYWQALRKLGYLADHIFLSINAGKRRAYAVVYQKGKGVRFDAGDWGCELADLVEEYSEVCSSIPKWSLSELETLWETSRARTETDTIILRLITTGIYPPESDKTGGTLLHLARLAG